MRPATISGAKHAAALVLYHALWSDPQIAAVFDLCSNSVARWRKQHGLEPINRFCAKIDHDGALAMWREGRTDGEIAKRYGAVPSGVLRWRQRHGLAPNVEPQRGLDTRERRVATRMLREGATRRQVADELGRRCLNPIQRLRRELGDDPRLRGTGKTLLAARKRASRDATQLRERILRAIDAHERGCEKRPVFVPPQARRLGDDI